MEELKPGLWHWEALHDRIGIEVSSYYLAGEGVLLNPMIPDEGLEWFTSQRRPEHVLLTNRHHDRDAWRFREAFGCAVHCIRNGVHEVEERGPAEPFDFGDRLPGGFLAYEVGAISDDETALHAPAYGALAVADGVVRLGGAPELRFVPDHLMDDPEQTKLALRAAYTRLLALDFDVLLLAHGGPVADGKAALRSFVDRP